MIWPQRQPTLHDGRIRRGQTPARPLQPKLYTEAVREIMSKTRSVLIASAAVDFAAGTGARNGLRPGQ